MNLVFLLTGALHGAFGEGRNGDDESIINGAVRRSLNPNSTVTLESILNQEGYEFESVEYITVTDSSLEERDSKRTAKHHTIVRGLVDEQHIDPADIAINDFGKGEYDLQYGAGLKAAAVTNDHNEDGVDLHKRYDGAGLKVPFTTRKRSKLTRAHQKQMSSAIASSWGNFATTRSYHMNEYFGLVKTEHQANFYFRIIPELRGFGLNYESVNACGGMAKYL